MMRGGGDSRGRGGKERDGGYSNGGGASAVEVEGPEEDINDNIGDGSGGYSEHVHESFGSDDDDDLVQ